ncbi:hypothetical protein K7B10_32645 [Streptomyces flavotricini]|uniref:Terminase small subunit n=1 Tax=Streptomyces flavotricini TaxID=66888 RepID=A0ABS8EET6_9ACTN|nr:hypothetical protein [Streptomyces flavotricini]MCC0099443.1 hypothetical protein [Streptomyces flavotricini]
MAAPEGLAAAGQGLWQQITKDYELSPDELALLGQTCRTLDELEAISAALAAGPAVVEGSMGQPKASALFAEARAHRLVLAKLLDQLALPAEGEEVGKTPNQERASKAANVRWDLERRRRGTA